MVLNAKQSEFIHMLMYETPGGLRFTQDSPILPSVWMAFAEAPHSQQELILTMRHNQGSSKAAAVLRNMLTHLRKQMRTADEQRGFQRENARVSYIPGQIAVRLHFDEMMRVVLPLTPWWHDTYDALRKLEREFGPEISAHWLPFPQPHNPLDQKSEFAWKYKRSDDLAEAMMLMRHKTSYEQQEELKKNQKAGAVEQLRQNYLNAIPSDLAWMARVGGIMADAFFNPDYQGFLTDENSLSANMAKEFANRELSAIESFDKKTARQKSRVEQLAPGELRGKIAEAFVSLYKDWAPAEKFPGQRMIWQITKNRPVFLAVENSSKTVKADAAAQVFDISCKNITWAVLDSGIDRNHRAFKLTTQEHETNVRRKHGKDGKPCAELSVDKLDSRIVKTLDFTRLRELLDFGIEINVRSRKLSQHRDDIVSRIAKNIADREGIPKRTAKTKAKNLIINLRQRIHDGQQIDWQDLEPAIVIEKPDPPTNDHGTHVAGILAADWIEDIETETIRKLPLHDRVRRMRGICPDINLIDVRVFREDGLTDEFELLAAIQYLRWMNMRAGTMQVHGANLSLSLIHEVRRFACGQTPVCKECDEASAHGMVMVAAAGNHGYQMDSAGGISADDQYRTVSITDPGNAQKVITVGATHRKRPHEYGVSYFSSRGPTGDGRMKPDLVAPGEKISGPVLNGRAGFKDGTSMAAPHVSGVAAMLMARYSELIAKPDQIKDILCDTATDLGRERYFQGHGLVDALRAMQSI